MKFLLDRMLGSLASWLRMLDADTAYGRDADDGELLERARAEGRVLLTRDRELAERARSRGVEARLLGPGDVEEWLADLHRNLGLSLEPKFERCSLCNGAPLRVATPGDLAGKEYVPRGGAGPFWACPDCRQVYWEGGHWRSIRRVLDGAREIAAGNRR
ncbi:MAG: Mut7-C RNAse domain-containing protein [Halobacteria archaeon]